MKVINFWEIAKQAKLAKSYAGRLGKLPWAKSGLPQWAQASKVSIVQFLTLSLIELKINIL